MRFPKTPLACFLSSAVLLAASSETARFRVPLTTTAVGRASSHDFSVAADLKVHVVRNGSGEIVRGYVDFSLADPLPDGTVVSELSIRMAAESPAVIAVPERRLPGTVKDRVRFQRSAPVRTDDPAGLAGLKGLLDGATPFYVSLTTNIGALKGLALRISGAPSEPAASEDGVWKEVDESSFTPKWRAGVVPPRFYRTFQLDTNAFTRSLRRAPMEFAQAPADRTSPVTIAIPMPDGQFSRFRIEESPVMEPALASQFPNFKTYRGKGIDDPTATMRFDWTPEGLHAVILLPGETVYVEPAGPADPEHYNSYYQEDSAPGLIHIDRSRPDAIRQERQMREEPQNPLASNISGSSNVGSSVTLRTYRLAVATTKGFTESALYGGGADGVVARNATLVNVAQIVNIMNALYERDLAIHFNLIATELSAIFDGGATPSNPDPGYTDGDSGTMLNQNQGFLDAAVGNGNYDIGHVLGLSPNSGSAGGIATLGVVCAGTLKARAATVMGIKSITGNFNADVQVLDHEVGHQFNAAHTTDSTAGFCASERNPPTAYEVGSGSTIMANAGTCDPENILRQGPDNYFHGNSLDLMNAYASAGGACFAASQPGNTAPTVTAPANVTIPMNTPFTLNATSSDAEGDSLTFNWEEFDAGASSPPLGDQGTQALFRSVAPNSSPARTFPALTYILNNANQPPATIPCPDFSFSTCIPGEFLPITNRTLHFRVTARDNHAAAGGVANSTILVTSTTTAGPFQVTQPNTAVSWQGGTNQTVTWSVAGTTSAPVSAANVKISLSTDGGVTFPTVLAASVPNNGSAQVSIPNSPTTTARIKVEAVGNIFFDISDVNFTITAAANNPVLVVAKSHQGNFTQGQQNATYTVTVSNTGGAATNGTTVTVTDTVPGGETLVSMSGNGWTCPGTQANNCTRTSVLPAGQSYLPITVTVSVLPNATSPQLNSVLVTGGGSVDGSITDSTIITPAPAITPTPPSLTFTALQGGSPPAGQNIGVAVSNAQAGGTITATVNLGTITGSGSSFTATIAAGATSSAATVNVALNQGALPLGTYNGSVTLHATGAPDVNVPVGLTVRSPSSTTLQTSPNPSTYGQAVTLTATVSPASAAGKVTFYSGTTVLGTKVLSSGQATLTTTMLASGVQPLKAYFSGNSTLAASTSPQTMQTVNAVAEAGFQAAASYPSSGTTPESVAVGDFNGDGKADLAVANIGSTNVSVLLGNGDGTFQSAASYSAFFPSDVKVGDFNGDGKVDLALACASASVLLGNGDGTFQTAVNYAAGLEPQSLAVGDFNGDGNADLVVANSNAVNNLSVLLGNGDGTFQTAVNYAGGSGPISIAVGDFDRDGKADIAIADYSGNNVMVLLGNGDGTFKTGVSYATIGTTPVSVAVGDFNGDGKADLALANQGSNNVSVLLGNGDGTFQAAVNYAAGSTPQSVVVGDFNGDGRADLALANENSNNVSVLLGNGDGTFQVAVNYAAGITPHSLAVGDFNRDGRSDLAVANFTQNTVSILLGAVPPSLSVAKTHSGSFTRGQNGAQYTITVSNGAASGPTSGTVTVTETVPSGETLVSMSGSGWTCPGTQANNCTRTSVLPAGQSYPNITVTVNVLANATSPQLNSVSVAGGGSITGNNTDSTVITPAPVITPTPPSLTFTAPQGGAPPAGQSIGVAVSNAQSGGTITATVNLGTITGSGSSFTATIAAGATSSAATVNVALNQGALPPGIYNGSVTLHATGAPDVIVPVTGSFNVVGTVSVTPNSGSGVGPQVFTAVYSDTSGASDLQVMYLDFGSVGDAPHDCKVAYAQGGNALFLFNDANTGALGPITLGGGGSLSNSQCTLFGGATAATPSGNNLTVPFTIQFLAGYGGPKNIFGMAQSYSGAKSANGAFQSLGTWTPAASTPGVVSVSPNSGSGAGPQVFTAVYSDTGGANDLQAVYLNFGSVGFAAHNCIAVYVPGPNALYLFTDDNSNAVGPIAEGAGGGSISNSQCTLTSGGTPATLSGTNLTVPFNITFKSGYGGKKTIFGLAQNYAGAQSGGGVLTSLGNWKPALTTPGAVSVSPNSGSGFGPLVFTAAYSDTGGANDLQVVYLSFGGSFLAANSCNVGYQPGNNQLLLFSDNNSTAATLGENGPGSVSNSQCTLSGGNTAAVISGTGATVPFTITFKAGFTGAKSVFGLAQSYDGTQSATTLLGSWTP